MTLKIFIGIMVVALVVVGGLIVFVSVFYPTPTYTTSPHTQDSESDSSTQNSTSGSLRPTATTKFSDIENAYLKLFNKLLAQKVNFVSVESNIGEDGRIYSLYASDIEDAKKFFPKELNFPIKLAFVDLTGDGVSEAVVYLSFPGACGTAGCPLDVYKKDNNTWVLLANLFGTDHVGVSSNLTNGFFDLFITVQGELGYQGEVIRYVWNGTTYEKNESVANWDGSVFQ